VRRTVQSYRGQRDLHSFPTRRSSDLAAQDRRGHRLKQLLTAQLGIAFGLQYRKPLNSFLPRGIGSAAPTVIAVTDEYPRPQFGSVISQFGQEPALSQSRLAEQKNDLWTSQIRYLLQQIRQPPE